MYKDNLSAWSLQVEKRFSDLQMYVKENATLILVLSAVALAAYGFELFNLNLTIDEEIHATYSVPSLLWIEQGRWGMYLLNKFVMPYTIIPFVPLFIALAFHLASTLLLLESWNVQLRSDRFVVGAIYVTFPTMAYMYTFSSINYGIGIGLSCVSLSSFIYARSDGLKRFLAVIPASFAIAIYQGFIPALTAVFLVCIVCTLLQRTKPIIMEIIVMSAILILSLLVYYLIQKLILVMGVVPGLSYVSEYFDLDFLRQDFLTVLNRIWLYLFLPVYLGRESIYSVAVSGIVGLLFVSFLGLFVKLIKSKLSALNILFMVSILVTLLILPFASGFLMQGYMSIRFLVGLPVVIAGVVMLGRMNGTRIINLLINLLVAFSIFQFITSTNHLFASSHLALEADRILASRLISRIENAQAETDTLQLKYIEIIGYHGQSSTELIPKIETFGASFFEWDEGSPWRISKFLQTVGFPKLEPLTVDQRAQMVSIADSMPVWPHKDSVIIVNDIVVVKFADYSDSQKAIICSTKQSRSYLVDKSFCKGLVH